MIKTPINLVKPTLNLVKTTINLVKTTFNLVKTPIKLARGMTRPRLPDYRPTRRFSVHTPPAPSPPRHNFLKTLLCCFFVFTLEPDNE